MLRDFSEKKKHRAERGTRKKVKRGSSLIMLAKKGAMAVLMISGIVNNSVSTRSPRRLLSFSDVPGLVITESVREPSLNSGKKLRPMFRKATMATTNKANVPKSIIFL